MSYIRDKIEVAIEEKEIQTQQFFSSWPPVYKWFLWLGIIGIIPTYFISKSLSKTYWNNRYNSSLIAAKPSFENPKQLKIGQAVITSVGQGTYAAAVEITNENLDLSLRNASINVSLQNGKGETVYTAKEKFFLLPNEKKYIIIPRAVSNEKIERVNVTLPDAFAWQKRLNIPKVDLQAPAPQTYNQSNPTAFVAEGYLQNNSAYAIKQVRLSFLLYDKSGQIIALTQRTEFAIKPFERRSYKILWPNVFSQDVNVVQVIPETDLFEEGNLSLEQLPGSPASNLDR